MPATIVSTANAEHYKWGGASGTDCDAWYLVKNAELNVIEELMPPGTFETAHHHVHARQFFFVLEGELTMMIEHHEFVLHVGEGIEAAPGQVHQALNHGKAAMRMVVTSQPPSHDDRIEDGAGAATTTGAGWMAEADVTALVLKVYRQMMAGKVDAALLTPKMNAALTPDVATQAQMLFTSLGEPAKLTLKMHQTTADGDSYVYAGVFTTGEFQVVIELNKAGQISGYRLAP